MSPVEKQEPQLQLQPQPPQLQPQPQPPRVFPRSPVTGRPGKTPSVMIMKKGGSASSRADGIATKGKTRGKMC